MTVLDWISALRADSLPEAPIGGLGGWFGWDATSKTWTAAHTWADYLERLKPSAHPYAEALRDSIVALRIWDTGDWHQSETCSGVPLFDDGTVATFSFRAWGDLLAAVWSAQLGRPYCYMDFYYATPAPKPEDFEVHRFLCGAYMPAHTAVLVTETPDPRLICSACVAKRDAYVAVWKETA